MNVNPLAFQPMFGFTCKSLPVKVLSYIPIIGQIGWGILLGIGIYGYKEKESYTPYDKAFFRAFCTRAVISISGAGLLLIPVDFVGTVMQCFKG